jgi:HEAT repeat protein
LSLAVLLLASPPVALRRGAAEPEEPPRDLPVIRAEGDPIRGLLGQIASPTLPEAAAQKLFDELVVKGAVALPSIAAAFRDADSDDTVVWIAARALARIGGPGARASLLEGLNSTRVIARLGAASGLTILKDPTTAVALERALLDSALVIRSQAADALGAMGSRRSAVALSEALAHPGNWKDGRSLFVRYHIVAALGAIGSIGGVDALLAVMEEKDPPLQQLALQALTTITGTTFREGPPNSPPSRDEVARWRSWWSQRKVAPPPEEVRAQD